MSEKNTVRSNGTLQLISGKKYRGELVAGETGAAFYAKGQKEPMAEWHYARMNHNILFLSINVDILYCPE